MTLFSYVVRWDHGFAPNPFHGVCTLATCKPAIRKKAKLGDWVLGTGSAERNYRGRAIFLMRVTEESQFHTYWSDPRFVRKQPVMNGSLKQRFGDNIYHLDGRGSWIQADSRHSLDERTNNRNLQRDTGLTDRVLIGSEFIYWGENAPEIPMKLQKFVIARPGWAEDFSQSDIDRLVDWAKSLGQKGQVGDPLEWRYERWWR
ncbi:hypothetical protein [Azospirillum rugosum]|uniref:Nmad2 family putative nucleotide modification protein n=1 Tax=Azospirillum rugosum TaxID=416170 RepID=UPI001AE26038